MTSILVALRLLRVERGPAVAVGLLVFVTALAFGLVPRIAERVADDALRRVVRTATPIDRNIALVEEDILPADRAEPLRRVGEEGDALAARLPAGVRAIVAERTTVVDSVRFAIEAATPDPSFIRLRIQPGAADRVRIVSGRAPTGATRSVLLPDELRRHLPQREGGASQPDEPVEVPVLEAAISTAAAARIGSVAVGQVVFLSVDARDPLSGRAPGVAAIEVTGLFEVIDPADPFWFGDRMLEDASIRSIGGDTRFLDVGALLAEDAYRPLVEGGRLRSGPLRYTWRLHVDPDRLASAALDSLIVDLRRLETTFRQGQVTNRPLDEAALRSGLLPLLSAHAGRWAAASALLAVVAIGPALVALAALALVAGLAARRRRPAVALVRGRGATLGQAGRAVVVEALVIVVPAVGAAIAVALLALPGGSSRPTIAAATLVAGAAVVLLAATAIAGTAGATRTGHDDDPPARTASARRLVLDAIVVTLAVAGAYLLRERGVRGASSAGTLAGADPLIAAVPALAGVAAGLAAIRLVPLPLRVLARIASRGRGLVPLLALRRAIHGGTTAAIVLVLLATAAIGTFSSAALGHLERASSASSWQAVGAPYRITAQAGSLPAALDPTSLPGVRAAAGLLRAQIAIGSRNLRIQFVVVDLAAYQTMVAGSPVDPAVPPEMLGPDPPGGVVPLLVSPALAERTDGVPIGRQVEIVHEGYHYQVRPVAIRTSFPTLPADAVFAVASRQHLRAVQPAAPLAPSTYFLDVADGTVGAGASPDPRAPADAELGALRAAVAEIATGATVESRAAVARAFDASPVTAAIVAGIALATVVAALYAALAVGAALALAGAARSTEVAQLRMIGLSRRDALGLVIVEHGPTVLFAFVTGTALGLGLFALLEPGLGLDALVGSRLRVPVGVDPRQLAGILGGIVAIAAVAIGVAAWAQRRAVAIAVLRRGVE